MLCSGDWSGTLGSYHPKKNILTLAHGVKLVEEDQPEVASEFDFLNDGAGGGIPFSLFPCFRRKGEF